MPRQLRVPGTERPRFREIDQAAEKYREVRDELESVKTRESTAKDRLIAAMKAYAQTEYVDEDAVPPLRITLSAGPDKVKVKETRIRQDEERGEAPVGGIATVTVKTTGGSEFTATPEQLRAGLDEVKRRKSAAKRSVELEAEADAILAKSGNGKLNDPKLKGKPERHRKAKTRTAAEAGATGA
jgi:hypothetical protein